MKRIYTYGHEQVQRNLTIGDIVENKKKGVKMTQVTAQNREEAEILSEQNIDMIITGSDTYEDVRNGAPNTFITAALFAGRFITKDDILNSLKELRISCKDVAFKIFGFSLTTFNIIISLIITIVFTKIYLTHENNK